MDAGALGWHVLVDPDEREEAAADALVRVAGVPDNNVTVFQVVVATPGRLWDLMREGHAHVANLRWARGSGLRRGPAPRLPPPTPLRTTTPLHTRAQPHPCRPLPTRRCCYL